MEGMEALYQYRSETSKLSEKNTKENLEQKDG
jgi:hypothetical protein